MRTIVPDVPIGTLPSAWRRCVGTGRFDLALRRDYQDSLALVQSEIGFDMIRGHGLFSDQAGVYRPYDAAGHAGVLHNFSYVDQIVDSYLALGISPFLELGFMPSRLASGDQTVFWWHGNVTPPSDHSEWARMVSSTLRHLMERYGIDTVRSWPIEVWNEPNLLHFWKDASQDAYHRLYEVTSLAVKEVDAELQVGGPSLSPGADHWLAPFADFVTDRDLPCDFVSRHAYSSGPAQHVPLGVYQTLDAPSSLLEQFASPRLHLAGTALADAPVHITEFNTSYRPDNPVHDTAYNAAYLAPVLANGGDLVDSFSYWTFSDMFEEEGVPPAVFHGGFGMLTHRQIKKPTFHLYAFMARMGPAMLARGEDHLVTRHEDGRVTILAWQPVGGTDEPEEPESHELRLSIPLAGGEGSRAYAQRSTVNESEGNAFAAWGEMGRPRSPLPRALDALREAAEPVLRHWSTTVAHGRVDLDLTLSRHEVSLVELTPVRDETPPWIDDSRIIGRTVVA